MSFNLETLKQQAAELQNTFDLSIENIIFNWRNNAKNEVRASFTELWYCQPVIALKLISELPDDIRLNLATYLFQSTLTHEQWVLWSQALKEANGIKFRP